jgi:multiple sugar transport system substrate-binding protein
MSTFRTHRRLAPAILALCAVSGCGLGGGTSDAPQSESLGEVGGEITFSTLQLKPTFTDYIEGVIADFEAKYPGTSVKWIDVPFEGAQEKIASNAAAGTLPDVINLNPNFAQPLERQGLFVNLDEVADGVKAQYVDGAWKAFQVTGQQGSFGFPWYLTSEVTMYNAEMFEAAGLDPMDPPSTFEELYSAAGKVAQSSGGSAYGMHPSLTNRFIVDLAKLGVPLLNADGTAWTFNTPEAVAHLEQLMKLYQSKALPPDSLTQDIAQENEAYQAGRIALLPSGPNFLKLVKENAPKIAAATKVGPQITGDDGVANVSVMGLLVPKSSKNKATALEFAKFITNAENQLAFAKIVTILPSVTEALQNPYFKDDSDGTEESKARRISAAQIANAENLKPVQYDERVATVVVGQVQLALKGELSAQEALDAAVKDATALLPSR